MCRESAVGRKGEEEKVFSLELFTSIWGAKNSTQGRKRSMSNARLYLIKFQLLHCSPEKTGIWEQKVQSRRALERGLDEMSQAWLAAQSESVGRKLQEGRDNGQRLGKGRASAALITGEQSPRSSA